MSVKTRQNVTCLRQISETEREYLVSDEFLTYTVVGIEIFFLSGYVIIYRLNYLFI